MSGLHNLPIQLTSFIGREREIAQIKAFLSTTRLMTLTGAGGVGKTRLALQVAAETLDAFEDGVWVVDLAPLADQSFVPQAAASVLSVREQSGRPLSDTLVAALSGKSLLLVLDNCEHVQPASASLVDVLLRGCPHVRVLATSREPLSVPGETLWRVPSLSLPDPAHLPSLENVRQYEAVRLFVERARTAQPAFALTSHNAPAVALICRRLDGIPLAIELAAPRVRVLAVEQIAARLDDRFRLLTGGSPTALPRHRTLRATMDWSYGLLTPPEQTLLRRLSVFAGGWTLGAAEAVCSESGVEADQILDHLTSLVDKSLILMETQDGEARYRLLETVRQYGRDKMQAAGDARGVQQRHRDWYLDLAEREESLLYGPGQVAALERLELEHDNLRTALQYSNTENDALSAARLAAALGWFWYLHGHWSEGRAWLENSLTRADSVPALVRARVLLGAGRITYYHGDHEQAYQLFEQGMTLCRETGHRQGIPWFAYWLSRAALYRGDSPGAAALLEEGLAVCRELRDTWWACQLLAALGEVAQYGREYERAVALFLEGLAISRATGGINNSIYFLNNLGLVTLYQGDLERTAAYYMECLALCKEVKHRLSIANGLEGLARVASLREQHQRAARLFGAAGAMFATLGVGSDPDDFDRAHHDQRVASTQAGLGEAAFASAWREGQMMTRERAIEYALESKEAAEREPHGKDRTGKEAEVKHLTAREREVAVLVARGLTNRQIASKLVITERTAETHVQNVLNKLGFTSRAQIAAWAVEQGLHTPTRQ